MGSGLTASSLIPPRNWISVFGLARLFLVLGFLSCCCCCLAFALCWWCHFIFCCRFVVVVVVLVLFFNSRILTFYYLLLLLLCPSPKSSTVNTHGYMCSMKVAVRILSETV